MQYLGCEGEGWVRCNNGRCIKMGLVCNGDDDCGDASDEYPTVNNRGYNCTNHVSCPFQFVHVLYYFIIISPTFFGSVTFTLSRGEGDKQPPGIFFRG